jgi:uncharacterized phage protein (TIGR01671 family)
MREIKFRAWDGEKMWNGFELRTERFVYPPSVAEGPQKNLAFMQYTGLKDKNGAEIYEGDVLRWVDWREELTEAPDVYRVDWLDREARFSVNCFRSGRQIDPKDDLLLLDDEFEVIGNVYENPELLRDGDD